MYFYVYLVFYFLNWEKLGQILKCYVPVSCSPKPNQSNSPSMRPFFFTSIQTLSPLLFCLSMRTLQAAQGFSFHCSLSSDTKGDSRVPLKCRLSSKKNWAWFLSKVNHLGEGLMGYARINNGCQKHGFIMLALELSVLKSFKMQKTMYSKCLMS